MKKHVVVVSFVMFMSTISTLKADLPVVPICTATGDQVQPDIDSDWIVWHDARNGTSNYDVFGYILSEPNEVEICTVSGSNQRYAKVSGNVQCDQEQRRYQTDLDNTLSRAIQ